MVSRITSYRWFIRLEIVLVIIACGLLVTGIVFAAPPAAPINTNDGIVDPQWSTPIYTSPSNRTDITDTLEIKYAWVMSDGNQLYFRIQTYAPAALISGYGAVAAIDCDQDGLTNTHVDRLITWEISNDALAYRYGDTFETVGLYCTVGFPCPYGERVNSPNNDNVEWRGDYSVIPLDSVAFPAGCRDAIGISIAIANMSSPSIMDNTPLYPWNVPTNVEVKGLKASSRPNLAPLMLGVLLLLIFAAGVTAVVNYKRREG
jgi:hypothetical protein